MTHTFAALALLAALANSVAEGQILWQIGQSDHNNAEFALAPASYSQLKDDGFFVVGESDAKRDWAYVHPGPGDAWAGGRSHTFTVMFGVKAVPQAGECRLQLDLLDTQGKTPPTLRIAVNGEPFDRTLPKGAGDDSIFGQPTKGREHRVEVAFPAALLQAGNNRIEITTLTGSWLLYDSLVLAAPDGVEAMPVRPFTELGSVSLQQGRLTASVIHAGSPVDAELSVDGQAPQQVRLASGRQAVKVAAPAVERARAATVALIVDGRKVGQLGVQLTPGVREIIVVFKTHFDIGYTDMASNVVQTYRTKFMDSALKVVDESRALPPAQQFAWTIPGWPLHKMLEDWPGQSPERQQRVRQAVKDGRFVVHALPFTTHTELLEPEDLIRGLGYSTRLARELGLDLPRDTKMTDVPEHAAMMATLLQHAGVTFMHIGCNAMSGAPQVPPLYWWAGPDGSRVLTMYSPDYGTGLLPPSDWPHRTWLALIHTGDNHGPPRPEEVKQVLDDVAKRLPGVKVRIGRLSDFGDAILAEKPDLPVVRADMPDTWIHGPMSDPAGARLARNTRPLLVATEALNTQLRAWGVPVADATATVAAAYEQSLLYGEHTWGGSIGWLGGKFGFGEDFMKERAAGRFQRIEGSWDEHTAYIKQARDLIQPALASNLKALAAAVQGEGTRVVVFNPLPWKRGGLVTVQAPITAALQSDSGDAVPAVAAEGKLTFFAADVPAMGYRSYQPVKVNFAPSPLRTEAASDTMEGPFFRATLDAAHGTVRSLTDKRTGRELVDASAAQGFGAFLYERFDHAQVWDYIRAYLKNPSWTVDFDKPGLPPAEQVPYRAATAQNFKLRFEQTPVSVAAVMEAPAGNGVPCAVTTRLILYRDEPFADLEITLHDKPFDSWPEAGWLCLPFKVAEPQFRLGRLGNIVDPAKDVIVGANRNLFGINTGVAIFDAQNSGVGFCPLDNPLVSLDTPGCWKFSKDFVPRKPVAYVNLFNNQWNTNFRLWNSGTWTARVRLWAFARYDADAALITPSLEARNGLLADAASSATGKLAASQRGLELSRQSVAVTAFGPNPDGKGTLLRLWELAGQSGTVNVKLPPELKAASAQPVDLRGRPSGAVIPVRSDAFEVPLKGFAPASFALQGGTQ
jgi:alpha-mannosidase